MPAEMPADPKALADEIERMTSHRIHIGSRSCLASVENARALGLFVDDNRAAILAALRATGASAAEAAMRERCAQACDDYSKASDAYVQRAIAERLSSSATYIGMRSAADRCAEKIRALPLSPGGQRDA